MSTVSSSIRNARGMRAAVILVTIVAFSPALQAPQIFDDTASIQDNASIRTLATSLHPAPGNAVTGRPVVGVSLWLNYEINNAFGIDQRPDPDGPHKTISYHLFNLLCHIASGLLLLGIVRRTLLTGRFGEAWQRNADHAALLVAAIWLLHPLQTEAVDYLIQRTELLFSLFLLATLYCSVRAWDVTMQSGRTQRNAAAWLVAGVACCALGMGSKEAMAGAPLLIVLYDRAFRVTRWGELLQPQHRQRRWFYAGLVASLVIVVALSASAPRGTTAGFASAVPWYEYLHSQGWAIAHYLRLALVPVGLSLDYGPDPVPHWRGIPGLVLLAALAIGTIMCWLRSPRWTWLAFLGSWFFVLLAPSSSFVPIATEIAAERRIYLALAAVVIAVVAALGTLLQRFAWRNASVRSGAAVLLLLLGALTFARSAEYRNPEALWRDAAARVPANSRAWSNLGFAVLSGPEPRPDEADSYFRKAVALNPSFANAVLHVFIHDLDRRNYADAATVLQRYPFERGNDSALLALGRWRMTLHDTAGAILVLERLTTHLPSPDQLVTLGVLDAATGRTVDARRALDSAVALSPHDAALPVRIGALLVDRQQPALAIPYLEMGTTRDSSNAMTLATLSVAYAAASRTGDAERSADRATHLAPDDRRVAFFAGRAMLSSGRAELAERYLTNAVTLGPDDPIALRALAQSKAALGKKSEAADLFQRVLQILPGDSAARAGLTAVH